MKRKLKIKVKTKVKSRFDKGFDAGYDKSYPIGWQQGVLAASQPFQGTSIIIPTYNQKELLRQCLESISVHTPEAHEIIVVDNGSTDGTELYLSGLGGGVRYTRLPQNAGFAAGINQGLRLARGENLLLLNNDTVVTARWLGNLLACLSGCPNAGLVGPVTNYISGAQQIETAYADLAQMHQFAESFNASNPELWQDTDRLTGFCVLMSRDTFRRLGYLDEGYEIGNCEDDDYGLRAKLLGLRLVIARDTFIHHVGSASMKTLGGQFDEIYNKNLQFFGGKWGDPDALLTRLRNAAEQPREANGFAPSHVIVRGAGETRYWIESGIRYPIEGGEDLEAVRVSQIELKNWATGPALGRNDVLWKLATLSSLPSPYGSIAEGLLVRDGRGTLYQSLRGKLRPLVGGSALEAWRLGNRPVYKIPDETLGTYPAGVPVTAPPVIRSSNL